MPDPRSDDDLMIAFGRGDGAAFEALYQRYRAPIYRYLLHAVGERSVADDLFQDVWSRVIDARTAFRRGRGFKRWAFRIAHNRLVDHWRALGRQPIFDPDALDDQAEHPGRAPDRSAERADTRADLRAALMALSPEQREAFLLREEAGLSLADIARRSGVGRETVKSRIRYAINRLRGFLTAQPEATGE